MAPKRNISYFDFLTKICDSLHMNISINGTNMGKIGKQIEEVSTTFPGVYIDENLTWKLHLKYIKSKISRSLYMIKQAKQLLSSG